MKFSKDTLKWVIAYTLIPLIAAIAPQVFSLVEYSLSKQSGEEKILGRLNDYYAALSPKAEDSLHKVYNQYFSINFKRRVTIERYKKDFEQIRAIDIVESKLIDLRADKAKVYITLDITGKDKGFERWSGTINLLKEGDTWFIDTMKGLHLQLESVNS